MQAAEDHESDRKEPSGFYSLQQNVLTETHSAARRRRLAGSICIVPYFLISGCKQLPGQKKTFFRDSFKTPADV